jgi:hypothetical protein
MPRKGKQKGYEELSPNQTVSQLFGHLPPGSKIAMTSRIVDHPMTQAYVDAFERRGFQWRILSSNQTGVQDFCFLQSSQRDLAGMARSTFVRWAAILGTSTRSSSSGSGSGSSSSHHQQYHDSHIQRTTWLYSIDSNDTRNALGDQALVDYNWTYHPELQSKIRFVHYSAP